jgi:hypothetical protein
MPHVDAGHPRTVLKPVNEDVTLASMKLGPLKIVPHRMGTETRLTKIPEVLFTTYANGKS